MVEDVCVEKAGADCRTAFARMIEHGSRNIRVVSGARNSIACVEIMKSVDTWIAKMTEVERWLMLLASNMTKDNNQVDATETTDTICRFFGASQWRSVIVKDGDRPIGYIMGEEL